MSAPPGSARRGTTIAVEEVEEGTGAVPAPRRRARLGTDAMMQQESLEAAKAAQRGRLQSSATGGTVLSRSDDELQELLPGGRGGGGSSMKSPISSGTLLSPIHASHLELEFTSNTQSQYTQSVMSPQGDEAPFTPGRRRLGGLADDRQQRRSVSSSALALDAELGYHYYQAQQQQARVSPGGGHAHVITPRGSRTSRTSRRVSLEFPPRGFGSGPGGGRTVSPRMRAGFAAGGGTGGETPTSLPATPQSAAETTCSGTALLGPAARYVVESPPTPGDAEDAISLGGGGGGGGDGKQSPVMRARHSASSSGGAGAGGAKHPLHPSHARPQRSMSAVSVGVDARSVDTEGSSDSSSSGGEDSVAPAAQSTGGRTAPVAAAAAALVTRRQSRVDGTGQAGEGTTKKDRDRHAPKRQHALLKAEETLEYLVQALTSKPFQPDDVYVWYWDTVVMLCMVYYWIFTPMQFAIDRRVLLLGHWWHAGIEVAIAVVFVADIVVQLNTAVADDGKVITEREEIVRRYMAGHLWRDVVAAVPVDIIIYMAAGAGWLSGWPAWGAGLVRIVLKHARTRYFFRVITPVKLTARAVKYQYQVLPNIMLVRDAVLALNILAVCWILINQETVHSQADEAHPYSLAMYWVLQTITTVGYGDISADNQLKQLFASVMVVLGGMAEGLTISIVQRRSEKGDVEGRNVDTMKETVSVLKHLSMPTQLANEVLAYQYHRLTSEDLDQSGWRFLKSLPMVMQRRIGLFVKMKFIHEVQMFRELPTECLVDLAKSLQQIIVEPEAVIIRAGDDGREMFFLCHGVVQVLSPQGDPWASMKPGAAFGEIALLTEAKRMATIMPLTYCELFRLDKTDFGKLIRKHRALRESVADELKKRDIKPPEKGTVYTLTAIDDYDYLGMAFEEREEGLVVKAVHDDGAARRVELEAGMLLCDVDGCPVHTMEDLCELDIDAIFEDYGCIHMRLLEHEAGDDSNRGGSLPVSPVQRASGGGSPSGGGAAAPGLPDGTNPTPPLPYIPMLNSVNLARSPIRSPMSRDSSMNSPRSAFSNSVPYRGSPAPPAAADAPLHPSPPAPTQVDIAAAAAPFKESSSDYPETLRSLSALMPPPPPPPQARTDVRRQSTAVPMPQVMPVSDEALCGGGGGPGRATPPSLRVPEQTPASSGVSPATSSLSGSSRPRRRSFDVANNLRIAMPEDMAAAAARGEGASGGAAAAAAPDIRIVHTKPSPPPAPALPVRVPDIEVAGAPYEGAGARLAEGLTSPQRMLSQDTLLSHDTDEEGGGGRGGGELVVPVPAIGLQGANGGPQRMLSVDSAMATPLLGPLIEVDGGEGDAVLRCPAGDEGFTMTMVRSPLSGGSHTQSQDLSGAASGGYAQVVGGGGLTVDDGAGLQDRTPSALRLHLLLQRSQGNVPAGAPPPPPDGDRAGQPARRSLSSQSNQGQRPVRFRRSGSFNTSASGSPHSGAGLCRVESFVSAGGVAGAADSPSGSMRRTLSPHARPSDGNLSVDSPVRQAMLYQHFHQRGSDVEKVAGCGGGARRHTQPPAMSSPGGGGALRRAGSVNTLGGGHLHGGSSSGLLRSPQGRVGSADGRGSSGGASVSPNQLAARSPVISPIQSPAMQGLSPRGSMLRRTVSPSDVGRLRRVTSGFLRGLTSPPPQYEHTRPHTARRVQSPLINSDRDPRDGPHTPPPVGGAFPPYRTRSPGNARRSISGVSTSRSIYERGRLRSRQVSLASSIGSAGAAAISDRLTKDEEKVVQELKSRTSRIETRLSAYCGTLAHLEAMTSALEATLQAVAQQRRRRASGGLAPPSAVPSSSSAAYTMSPRDPVGLVARDVDIADVDFDVEPPNLLPLNPGTEPTANVSPPPPGLLPLPLPLEREG